MVFIYVIIWIACNLVGYNRRVYGRVYMWLTNAVSTKVLYAQVMVMYSH